MANELLIRQSSPGPKHTPSPLLRRVPSWKKLLYLKQSYPDNYTDKSFLSQLKRNTTVAKYSYFNLVDDFCLILLYISSLLLVVLMFSGIYLHRWNSILPTIVSSIFSILGFGIVQIYDKSVKPSTRPSQSSELNLKSFILIIFILLILSPILKSLTKSAASDSAWALSFALCLCNTIFHDYSMNSSFIHGKQSQQIFSQYKPILSTNISLSNAIVLASRLTSTSQVFFFILFAVQINILLPLLDFNIRRLKLHILHYSLLFVLFNLVNYLIFTLLGSKILIYWFICVFFIVFGMPSYFLFLQRYKNELQGPWDMHKPIINKN
ncbi:phosphatidylinositol N-acetylglucosaminyltransferase subunit C [Scheffersomyces coipomensis]|uniref:phosphatidylinositol N-acetylglucosaminyltransferase subunit C n=1 Tax=Scheffersomyces coipomensis TaxID=1788519 RepID=UPI00315CF880